MLWFYVSALAVLVGAELNAEIEHASPYGKEPGEQVPGEKKKIGAVAERAWEEHQAAGALRPAIATANCDIDDDLHASRPRAARVPRLSDWIIGGLVLAEIGAHAYAKLRSRFAPARGRPERERPAPPRQVQGVKKVTGLCSPWGGSGRMSAVVERLFRFLFKYPPLMFQQGDFTWGLSRPVLLVVAAGDGGGGRCALLTYRGVSAADRPRDRVVLVGLRARRARGAALLSVPADADSQGGGAAAELSRRADRRFAQHGDRRPRRPAAQRVRPGAVRAARTRSCSTRCRSASSCASSASRRRPIGCRRPAT